MGSTTSRATSRRAAGCGYRPAFQHPFSWATSTQTSTIRPDSRGLAGETCTSTGTRDSTLSWYDAQPPLPERASGAAQSSHRVHSERMETRADHVSLDSREQCASFAAWREWRIDNGHPQPIAFDLYTVPEGFAGHLVGILMKDGGHRQRCSLENVGPGAGDDGIVRRDFLGLRRLIRTTGE